MAHLRLQKQFFRRPVPQAVERVLPRPLASATALLLAGFISGALAIVPVPAQAQAAGQADEVRRDFAIVAGPLGQALNAFAGAAGVELSVDASLLEGKHSEGLSGSFTVREGFEELLRGHGLQAVREANGSYTLSLAAGDGATLLSEVKVQAAAVRDGTTEGTGSYTTRSTSTATRLELSPRETPQTVTVITNQMIDDFAAQDVTDIMKLVPGVTVSALDSDRNIYTARGFSLQVQYDGTPFGGGLSGEVIPVPDAAVIDRTEVLLGAAGLLHGAGEPGGSIDIIWKRPTPDPQVQADISVGAWDTRRLVMDVSGPLVESRAVRGRLVALDQSQESFRDFEQSKNSLFYTVIEGDVTESTVVSARFQFQDLYDNVADRSGLPTGQDGNDLDWPRDTFLAPVWNRWDKSSETYWLTLEQQLPRAWFFKAQASRVEAEDERLFGTLLGDTFDDVTGDVEFERWAQRADDTTDSAELFARGPFDAFGREHELVVGANGTRWEWGSRDGVGSNVAANLYSFDPRTSVPMPELVIGSLRDVLVVEQYGVYSTGRFNLSDRFKTILGGRVSWYEYDYPAAPEINSEADAELTPYAGVIYDVTSWASVYASYTDIFAPQAARGTDGNALDPVVGSNYEAGFKTEFYDGRLNASVAVYRVEKTNEAKLIESIPFDINNACGGDCYEATGRTRTDGFDLNISGEIRAGWQILAGLSQYQKGEEDTARLFNLSSSYTLPGGRWTVGGGLDTRTDIVDFDFTQEARTLVNLFGAYRLNEHLAVSLNVDNLFDEEYYDSSFGSGYSERFYGEPRRWMLSVRGDY